MGVAGAAAITNFTPTTAAYVNAASITATNSINVQASSDNNTSSVADGSATTGNVGVGVAVAIDHTNATNTATLEGAASLSAPSVMVQALTPAASMSDVHTYGAQATSGASGQNVGVAGALAINIVSNTSEASVAAGSHVTASGSPNLTLNSQDTATEPASALPSNGGGVAGKVGIGLSVALNIDTNSSKADLGDQALLTGVHNLSLTAGSTDTVSTDAESGAATSGSGGQIALSPSLALTVVTNTTEADVGAPDLAKDPLTVAGTLSATATHTGSATTTGKGASGAAGTASVGASLALAFATDTTTATTLRSLGGGSDVTLSADGNASSTVSATATASGGPTNTQAQSNNSTADKQNAKERTYADGEGGSSGNTSKDAATPSASTSDGSVTVAAAIAVNVVDNEADATIPDGLSVTSGGVLTVKAAANGTGTGTAARRHRHGQRRRPRGPLQVGVAGCRGGAEPRQGARRRGHR